ncbi:flagellar hook assembly protein FlgD [Desulfoluna spongiiphila]|uniref:flagellar hook assembly protein FlgD n=1 Tax=Desulfoluna spongiiphila TaxID=419481 RepID=UPI001253F9AE|nr:flagellar hook assembly protein FlgD [Desulfoluna spongiiphila]VVS90521.1 flagellar hook capping protein [Desulfoluna spongiiphila]
MTTSGVETTYNNRSIFIDGQSHGKTGRKTDEDEALGKNAFLTMMVAQMKNQDPLNPLDGTDFTAQLAQFSGLEQQVNMNDNLKSLLAVNQASKEENNLFDYIGKEVVSNGNPVSLSAGSVTSGGHYTLKEPAMVNIMVYNPEGVLVKDINSGTDFISQGRQQISWDGTDEDGNHLADGKYIYKIIARNAKGDYASVSTTDRGMVEGITREGGRSFLVVDGRKVAPGSVAKIVAPEKPPVAAGPSLPGGAIPGGLPPEIAAQLFGTQGAQPRAAMAAAPQPQAAPSADGGNR